MTPEEHEARLAYARNYREANREKINARQNQRRRENPEANREAARKFRRNNPGYHSQWRLDNPEKNAEIRRIELIKQTERYRNDSEYREKKKAKQRAISYCVHGGQSDTAHIPRALIDEVRLKCIEKGLDPGIKCHMLLAIIDVQTKYSNMGRAGDTEYNWLHPDDMDHRAQIWSGAWRNSKTLSKNFYARNQLALDYIYQASNHDGT